ncbi:MAG: RagB/SusD family nutrient uptake outer membrane protein [Muribaculaceae bacterium]|nr:RagB/SusD family nutrient uptake outer membrane protein [Muribaculaceae bacterium]
MTAMKKYIFTALLTMMIALSGCDNYIDVMPKGMRIPKTLADYEALLRNEYSANYLPSLQALYLINDKFVEANNCRNVDDLRTANYMWKESRNRCELNSSTEDMFDNGYGIIGIVNTIIEEVPSATECTEAERAEVLSYAHAIRAFVLYYIVNFYADAYDPAKAASTPGIPLIYSGGLGSPWHQGTVKEVYDQILADFNKAIELGIPETSMTAVHPNRAAVEGGLARVYLSMRDYDAALTHANAALQRKSDLFEWIDYYNQYKNRIDNPEDYTLISSPMDHTCVENLWFCSGEGNPNYPCADIDISVERASKFEQGDMKALVRWKKYTSATDTYYKGMLTGYYNLSGIATPEVYLIKAECQARKASGSTIDDALTTLDKVRKSRIHPDFYQPSAASNSAEALELIRRTKDNEMIKSIIPFIDMKRYNAEGTYARTLTKEFDGQTYTLPPTSHLWTMVFPANAINRPGNGVLTQNSK